MAVYHNSNYKCIDCGSVFAQNLEARRHAPSHVKGDQMDSIECEACRKKFTTYELYLHMRLKHHRLAKRANLKCGLCNQTFQTFQMRRLHYDLMHFTKACKYCEAIFHSDCKFNRHMIRTANKCYRCRNCSLMFSSRKWLPAHAKRSHLGESVTFEARRCRTCFYCKEPYDRIDNLNLHIRSNHLNAGYKFYKFDTVEKDECNQQTASSLAFDSKIVRICDLAKRKMIKGTDPPKSVNSKNSFAATGKSILRKRSVNNADIVSKRSKRTKGEVEGETLETGSENSRAEITASNRNNVPKEYERQCKEFVTSDKRKLSTNTGSEIKNLPVDILQKVKVGIANKLGIESNKVKILKSLLNLTNKKEGKRINNPIVKGSKNEIKTKNNEVVKVKDFQINNKNCGVNVKDVCNENLDTEIVKELQIMDGFKLVKELDEFTSMENLGNSFDYDEDADVVERGKGTSNKNYESVDVNMSKRNLDFITIDDDDMEDVRINIIRTVGAKSVLVNNPPNIISISETNTTKPFSSTPKVNKNPAVIPSTKTAESSKASALSKNNKLITTNSKNCITNKNSENIYAIKKVEDLNYAMKISSCKTTEPEKTSEFVPRVNKIIRIISLPATEANGKKTHNSTLEQEALSTIVIDENENGQFDTEEFNDTVLIDDDSNDDSYDEDEANKSFVPSDVSSNTTKTLTIKTVIPSIQSSILNMQHIRIFKKITENEVDDAKAVMYSEENGGKVEDITMQLLHKTLETGVTNPSNEILNRAKVTATPAKFKNKPNEETKSETTLPLIQKIPRWRISREIKPVASQRKQSSVRLQHNVNTDIDQQNLMKTKTVEVLKKSTAEVVIVSDDEEEIRNPAKNCEDGKDKTQRPTREDEINSQTTELLQAWTTYKTDSNAKESFRHT